MFKEEVKNIVSKGVNWRSYPNEEIEEAMLYFCQEGADYGYSVAMAETKELIQKLISSAKGWNSTVVLKQARQFLKDLK